DDQLTWASSDKTATVQVLVDKTSSDKPTSAEMINQCKHQFTSGGGTLEEVSEEPDTYTCSGRYSDGNFYYEHGILMQSIMFIIIWSYQKSNRENWGEISRQAISSFKVDQ
ncbi:hypothetical protein, partial [Actinocorallia aurantiaca]|uniref:hypothetical protein n=1 Tax=Actinocorallia aurantiaca TaxID=46204 RepID=UPI0031D824AF